MGFYANNVIQGLDGLKEKLKPFLNTLKEGRKMPLMKSASKKAFKKNITAEVKSGKPLKQSLAIAYSVQRKAGGKAAAPKKGK